MSSRISAVGFPRTAQRVKRVDKTKIELKDH